MRWSSSRVTPVSYESTLVAGKEAEQIYLVNFENQLANPDADLSNYISKAPTVEPPATPARESDLSSDVSKAREAHGADYIYLVMRASSDSGHTWTDPWELLDSAGERIQGNHQSLIRMGDGKLGLIYNDHRHFPDGHPGRDGGSGMMFPDSADEGRTWSNPVMMYPHHAMCCAGHAIVLDSGRILAPAYRLISFDKTVASEADNNLSFSFVLRSDDHGKTWQLSLSELFLHRYGACYSLGEPTVVPLNDGRLLMDLRSIDGRRYQAFSADDGVTWMRPHPLRGIASSSVPSIISGACRPVSC